MSRKNNNNNNNSSKHFENMGGQESIVITKGLSEEHDSATIDQGQAKHITDELTLLCGSYLLLKL